MYQFIIKLHVWTSALFIVVALIACYKFYIGYKYDKPFTNAHKKLEIYFISLLYLGLILGTMLYFFLDPAYKPKMESYQEAVSNASQRFWAIEHFCVMLFAVVLAQIGKIFTVKNKVDSRKFKYALFYYGVSTLITFISFSIYAFHKLKLL